MGICFNRLDSVVLLLRNCPSTNFTLGCSNSIRDFLPHHTFLMRLLNVVAFVMGIPCLPLITWLNLNTFFLGLFTIFLGFVAASLFFFFVFVLVFDVLGLVKRSSNSLTLSMYVCSPCVKTGVSDKKEDCGSASTGAATVVSTALLDMSATTDVVRLSTRLFLSHCSTTHGSLHEIGQFYGSSFRCLPLTGQRFFDTVTGRSADRSQRCCFSCCSGCR